MAWLFLLLACADDGPAWAVNQMSMVPSATGGEGTQTWAFYTARWGDAKDDRAYVCARAQTFTATVTSLPAGCPTCRFAYTVTLEELGTDCSSMVSVDPSFELPVAIAVGDVPDELAELDPHEGRSFGWYVSFDGVTYEPFGFAWDESLDWDGDPGPPGWNSGQPYTLFPAYAWDLAGTTG